MHILFVHPNFPGQFGPVALHLAQQPGYRCTFVSQNASGEYRGIQCLRYVTRGGATERTHYCSRTFENAIWHTAAVHEALAPRPDIQPDVIVGHSGFGSTLYLKDLYPKTPIINLFEFFYHPANSDLDFRPDFPPLPIDRLRARSRNAMILLDLENCDLGYCPTRWQKGNFPDAYQHKLRVVFDGIDTSLWTRTENAPRQVAGTTIPPGMKIVTYATRGMESMRGFDIFMQAAQMLANRRTDVLFVVVGQDRVCYGGDARFTSGKTFKEWVLSRGDYDLSRFLFTGLLPEPDLARLFSITDAHVYLTVPFVLSWSLLNAMACGAPIVASATDPVREVITHDATGLLAPFFEPERFADALEELLDQPDKARHLGAQARALIHDRYTVDACLPRFLSLCQDAVTRARQG